MKAQCAPLWHFATGLPKGLFNRSGTARVSDYWRAHRKLKFFQQRLRTTCQPTAWLHDSQSLRASKSGGSGGQGEGGKKKRGWRATAPTPTSEFVMLTCPIFFDLYPNNLHCKRHVFLCCEYCVFSGFWLFLCEKVPLGFFVPTGGRSRASLTTKSIPLQLASSLFQPWTSPPLKPVYSPATCTGQGIFGVKTSGPSKCGIPTFGFPTLRGAG